MFLLVVVLSVHVSFGRHGQAIQRPKETWTGNTNTKRNMDSQYNDQKKHGQTIQRPKETWTDNTTTKRRSLFLLVVVLSVHVSFGRCIVCPCFFWSLYCLSMFLLGVVLPVHVSDNTTSKRNMDSQYNDQKKHGQTIQRPKETWTGNITTKGNMDRQYNNQKKYARNMDRQYNYQKKLGQTIQRPKETWAVLSVHVSFGRCIVCPCFFWSFYCLSMFLLVVVLPVHVSFGRCIACPCFLIQRPKETWTDNTTTKRNMDRQYNCQKKHGQTIQRPKETWTDNTTTKRNMDRQYKLSVHVSFGRCIVCPCFFWSFYCLSMFLLVVVLSVHVSFGRCIACQCFFWSLF
jgi:hypothetical protein